MYFPLLLSSLCMVCTGFAQTNLPVVKAGTAKATIYEQGNPAANWNINPAIPLDAFTTNKLIKAESVVFKTDIDSIRFILKPGAKKNFIVLLRGKDSCFTRIQSPAVKNFRNKKPELHDTIPFFVNTYNTNFLQVVFNTVDSLIMNFDTGATEISFTTDALQHKIKSHPQLYNRDYDFAIGNYTYQSKVHDNQLAGNETDGLVGWDVFDGMIVELNYDRNQLVAHSKMPRSLKYHKGYASFNIRYLNNRPFIESEVVQGSSHSKDWFLFDLGYQRTVMLDNDKLMEKGFSTDSMEVIKKVIMHGARGNEVPVLTLNLKTLKVGQFELNNVPVQLLGQSKPMNGVNIHILGNEVLKRFNTILDFQENKIYLKPNHLYDSTYTDSRKQAT